MSAVHAAEQLKPSVALVGLGYLDLEKILESFSVSELRRRGGVDTPETVRRHGNGQFIPAVQFFLLHNIPYFAVGRDRLVEMGAAGRLLLPRPLEVYSLFLDIFKKKKSKNINSNSNTLTPALNQVLAEDGSRFCLLKLHQLLYSWFVEKQEKTPEIQQEFTEKTFLKRWLVGRNASECALRQRAVELEKAKPQLPAALLSKKKLRIMILCDIALQKRLAERLLTDLHKLRTPQLQEMIQLQDESVTKFHLCLVIYFVLPVLTAFRLLWKKAKKMYLEYAVVGGTVSVGGDEVIRRLTGESEEKEESEESNGETNTKEGKGKLEIVETRWMGLKHIVRDTSRD
ncbi:hypothetical protein, conserved [Eimeria brunetti]|uniref:Uncharacterized protein n=1 Tax=Eimeria brunetti TaxID=51314 RepID=U6LMA1_9EIME|nr:hypothetical protein, conserved [Eimeria brunetti]